LSEDHKAEVLVEAEAELLWGQINDWHELGQNVLRLSVPLSDAASKYEETIKQQPECAAAADIGAGIIRVAFDADGEAVIKTINRLRESVSGAGGSVVIERAPAIVRQRADAWGDVGATARIMRSIKAKFDPQAILNPGRYVGGI
jgi:glycolate oxidase FAD binding subunit